MARYNTMLTIAGSDSVGGAGILADVKVATLNGVYAMTAITAITAQNTCGVQDVLPTPVPMLTAQIRSVCTDVIPDAVKIGMIPNAECAEAIADMIQEFGLRNVVLDPVMVSTSGDALASGEDRYLDVLMNRLAPLSALVTPNIPEAERMLGTRITDMESACKRLSTRLGVPVLLKGGHSDANLLKDTLCSGGEVLPVGEPTVRIETKNTHGTGCVLSSAIASRLAKGLPLTEAVAQARKQDIAQRIAKGADYELGRGFGPIYLLNL